MSIADFERQLAKTTPRLFKDRDSMSTINTDDHVLVEYDGSYNWQVIAKTAEAGRRMIVKECRSSGYAPSENMKDVTAYRVTPLSDFVGKVNWG